MERRPSSLSASLVFGTAVHRGLEGNFNQKIYSRIDLSAKRVVDIFAEKMESEKDNIEWEETTLGKELDMGQKLLTDYITTYAPPIVPIKVEHKFIVSIPKVETPFTGIIDLLDNGFILMDFKTTSRTPSESTLSKYYRQLCAYGYGILKLKSEGEDFTDKQIKKLNQIESFSTRLDFLVKLKTPKIHIVDSLKINLPGIKQFVYLIQQMDQAIKSKTFPPNLEHYLCNPKYCSYWTECSKEPDDIVLIDK